MAARVIRIGVGARRRLAGSQRSTLRSLLLRRTAGAVVTLWAVSLVVFAATEVLPGNAAVAILGHSVTPARLHALEAQLHLNQPEVAQYWNWLSGLLTGHPGTSLANGQPVWPFVAPRLRNSAELVITSGIVSTLVGMSLGALAALRRDSAFDHVLATASLAITALPEFVVGVVLVMLFATEVLHVLPGISFVAPGSQPWSSPRALILPVATLVIATVPYLLRMVRAACVEALESDYVELARLKGLPEWRVLVVHALPNAVAASVQVIGLNFLYLAGGIVVVEYVFSFPGIGQGLVNAVSNRDVPVIQFIVMALALFYVFMNIVTDLIALAATPTRRFPR